MKSNKEIDYREASPQTVLELKKTAIRLYQKGNKVRDIVEITGLADQTVRNAIKKYKHVGFKALNPKNRDVKKGQIRHY